MKRTMVLIASFAALVVLTLPGFAFADTVVSVSSPATVSEGDTFAVDVDIADVTDLLGYQLDLNFNASILQATGTITEGSFFQSGGGFVPGAIDNTLGSITLNANTLLGPGPGLDGGGTLIEFQFMAVGAGVSGLDLANVILVDSNLNSIDFSSTDGSVTVAGSGPVSTPEPGTLLLLTSTLCTIGLLTITKRV